MQKERKHKNKEQLQNHASCCPVKRIVGQELAALFTGDVKGLDKVYKTKDGNIFATDGHMAVVIEGCVSGLPTLPKKMDILDFTNHNGVWIDVPSFVLPKVEPQKCHCCKGSGVITKCEECDGEGEITFDSNCNSYEVECLSCGGDGYVSGGGTICDRCGGKGETIEKIPSPVVIGNHHVNAYLLDKILQYRPMAKISTNVKSDIHFMKFNDGYAAVMGMLK